MLVGGLGEVKLGGLLSDGFLVGDNRVTLLDLTLGELFLKILKADLNMEFSTSGNNMLTRLFGVAENQWVGLGEFTETLNKLGEVGGVLDLNSDTHNRGDGVLHDLDAVSIFMVGDGTLLQEVLIDTDESDGVTARNIGNSLDFTGHHDDGSLDVLNVKIVLGSWDVVRSHNSDLLSSGDGTAEDTTESVETTLVVGGDHLGDENHKGTVLVALLNGLAGSIIDGSLIKVGGSVSLGLDGGGELHDDHLKESLSSVNPLLEDALEEILLSLLLLWS